MSGQGVTIDVVSVQNEPDIQVSYDSCDWTANQLLNFVRDYGDRKSTRLNSSHTVNSYAGFCLKKKKMKKKKRH